MIFHNYSLKWRCYPSLSLILEVNILVQSPPSKPISARQKHYALVCYILFLSKRRQNASANLQNSSCFSSLLLFIHETSHKSALDFETLAGDNRANETRRTRVARGQLSGSAHAWRILGVSRVPECKYECVYFARTFVSGRN